MYNPATVTADDIAITCDCAICAAERLEAAAEKAAEAKANAKDAARRAAKIAAMNKAYRASRA